MWEKFSGDVPGAVLRMAEPQPFRRIRAMKKPSVPCRSGISVTAPRSETMSGQAGSQDGKKKSSGSNSGCAARKASVTSRFSAGSRVQVE